MGTQDSTCWTLLGTLPQGVRYLERNSRPATHPSCGPTWRHGGGGQG